MIFVEETEEEEEEEEEPEELTFGERFNQAASGSWGGFVSFSQGLLIVLIWLLPTLVLLGLVAFVIILIIRKYKKWRKDNPKKQKATNPQNYSGYQNQTWQNNNDQRYYDPNSVYTNQSPYTDTSAENVVEKSEENKSD